MLVLSRKKKEKIVVQSGPYRLEITVTEVRGDRVRLGFSAPREVQIDRAEVAERRTTKPAA